MPVNFDDQKITLYAEINSNPIAPSATRGGNITHFYEQYNELIDLLTQAINALENTVDSASTDLTEVISDVATLETATTNELTIISDSLTILTDTVATLSDTVNNSVVPTLATLNADEFDLSNLQAQIQILNENIASLEARIEALEPQPEPLPMPGDYVLENLALSETPLEYSLSESEGIAFILVTGFVGSVDDIYFFLNGNKLTATGWGIVSGGINIAFDDYPPFVSGDVFGASLRSGNQSGVTVSIQIVPPSVPR